MRILLTGASGFIGRHLATVLASHGHTVVAGVRGDARPAARESSAPVVHLDFNEPADRRDWAVRLRGFDAVINAVGIFREQGRQTFQALHVDAPRALFDACVEAGVSRVIQISALGADADAASEYHLSKWRADAHLATLPLAWTVVQPSLVFGADGASAQFFAALSSLPLIPLPGKGTQQVQPLHIDDLCAAIAALVADPTSHRRVIPLVGGHAITLRRYLADIRRALGLGPAHFLMVPLTVVRAAATVARGMPGSLLTPDSLAMLVRGNTADPAATRGLLARDARGPEHFVRTWERSALRTVGQMRWLLPLLRLSVALVWIVTGIVSLGLYPTQASYELLYRSGVPAAWAPFSLYSAAMLDLVFGFAVLLQRHRRLLWIAQMTLIAVYTLIISIRMPEFWLHPYGPLLKNLPMLATIYLLYRFEDRTWNTSS
jgi:uncharacterized protein YbjT (DUF2867 family)/uncharacterized membrane protein YphA (DoxX/SURF4 family)